jgi:LysR family glycine cleavage system transcriptional activator
MKVPPLNPLKVFEVVARTGNLTSAANELRVSQSAVSRQIAVLEEYLGVQLFLRERIGVRLTDVGKIYALRIAPAFEQISEATSFITQKYSDNVIRLRTYTALTARWLIPRLPRFNNLHPDIEVKITNSSAPLDFGSEQCDVAIVFGNGNWPGADATLLIEDVIEPVCSPTFLASGPNDGDIESTLRGKRLLVSKYRKDDWLNWLAHIGVHGLFEKADTMVFSSSLLTWQAAMDGLGFAIGQQHLLDSDIKAERLIRPFKKPLRTCKGHYIVTPSVQRYSAKLLALKDWLLQEANQSQANGSIKIKA